MLLQAQMIHVTYSEVRVVSMAPIPFRYYFIAFLELPVSGHGWEIHVKMVDSDLFLSPSGSTTNMSY